MTTETMAPAEQKRQKLVGSGQGHHLYYGASVKGVQKRQRFGGFGNRIGNDRNGEIDEDGDSNDGSGTRRFSRLGLGLDSFNEEAAGAADSFKDGVSSAAKKLGNFFNPTRKAAATASTSTDASTTTSTTSTTQTISPTETTSIPSPAVSQPTSTTLAIPPPPTSAANPISTPSAPVPVSTSLLSPVALPIVTPPTTITALQPTSVVNLGPGAAPSTDQPRKGISEEATTTASTSPMITVSAPPSISSDIGTLISATPIANEKTPVASDIGDPNWKLERGMSPVGQRVLIAAGTIGAFLIILGALFFILRIRRGETIAMFARRKCPKYGSRVFRERQKPAKQRVFEAPPIYSSEPDFYGHASAEKVVPSQQKMEGFYTPGPLPALTIPARTRAATVSSIYSPQQDDVSPMTSVGQSPTPFIIKRTQTETFYNIPSQNSLAPTDLNEIFIQHGLHTGSQSKTYTDAIQTSQMTREVSDPYGMQNTALTSQASDLQNSQQREANRLSTLSSLSSGFGDGLIIQDTETIRNPSFVPPRQRQQTTRFSWQTTASKAPGTNLDRTSTYTTASVDTAPRFRTVNSWVAQQTGRVQRQQMMASDIPAMPPVPAQLQSGVTPINHQRQESDISAFNHHPGDKVRLSPGSRVTSSVLDRKFDSYTYRSTG